MATKLNYEWRETQPGQYERNIDEAEQFYTSFVKAYEGSGHSYFAITACTGIRFLLEDIGHSEDWAEDIENVFRYAWTRLRCDHPTLAAPVEYDNSTGRCKKIYRSPRSKQDVDAWLEETFKVIDNGMNGNEFANTDPVVGRYATIYLITPPSISKDILRRDILFRSPHDIIDGMGTLHLFNNFLHHVSQALITPSTIQLSLFGGEQIHLSPPLRIAANIPSSQTQSQLANNHATQHKKTALMTHPQILDIPISDPASLPNIHPLRSQRLSMSLPRSTTSLLLAKCKSLNVSITQAVHASIALTLRNMQPPLTLDAETPSCRYISYALVNLRSVCSPLFNTAAHAAAVYHCISADNLVVDMTIQVRGEVKTVEEEKEEFMNVLGVVKEFYQSFTPDEEYISLIPTLFASKTPQYNPSPQPEPLPPPNPHPSISLSSLGIIDKIIQPIHEAFEVLEPWVMGAEYDTGWGVFLGTWNGKLSLSVGFNEAWWGREGVEAFLEGASGVLQKGLGLDGLGERSDWA